MIDMNHVYYTLFRPAMIGAIPRHGLTEIENFGERKFVPSIGREAWAKVTYNRELTNKEISDYELMPEGEMPNEL
jgi:hypothetical protein